MSRQKLNGQGRPMVELFLILLGAYLIYLIAGKFDVLESLADFSRKHERWEIDELVMVFAFLALAFLFLLIRRWLEARRMRNLLSERNRDLETAMVEIKELKGILPICSSCKKIRDDDGIWQQIEIYVRSHTSADFSHGICPECRSKLYPELKHADDS